MKSRKRIRIAAYLLAAVLFAVAASACGKGNTEENPGTTEEEGNMKSREVVERDADGNIIKLYSYDKEGNLQFTHVTEWENGRILKKTSYDGAGNETGSQAYEYDARGNNTVGTWFQSGKGILMKAEFVYDEKDRAIEVTHYGAGTIATNKAYRTYDANDLMVSEIYYGSWPDGEPVYITDEYDATGFLIRQTTKDAAGNLLNYEEYRKNDFGKIGEYTHYNAEGKPEYTIKYYFDEAGNKTKTEHYDGEGNLLSTTY